MRRLDPTTLDYFDHAPVRIFAEATIPASPAAVFDALADAPGWTAWFPLLHRAAWIRGDGGIGAERAVALRLLGRFDERMIAWDPGQRLAFTMVAATSPFVRQMAEDYRLTAVGDATRIDWIMAATPTALGRVSRPALERIGVRMFAAAGRRLSAVLHAHGAAA